MTRHKDQHDAILTRRRGDTEAHPLHRTVPESAGSFRFIRTQGHNNKHASHGIRLCHGTELVVLCTHSPVNDEEPFLGDLLEVRVVHTGGQSASQDSPMSWRQDRSRSGNNILTMGIIHETVQRWIDDEPEWLIADGVIFQTSRYYPDSDTEAEVTIPDSLSVLGRFAGSGARLAYHFSGVESGKPRMEFRLNGSRGALRFDAFQKQLFYSQAGSTDEKKIMLSQGQNRGWQVEADFVRSIREHSPVELTSFDQGVRYMAFTEMVAESLANASARIPNK